MAKPYGTEVQRRLVRWSYEGAIRHPERWGFFSSWGSMRGMGGLMYAEGPIEELTAQQVSLLMYACCFSQV